MNRRSFLRLGAPVRIVVLCLIGHLGTLHGTGTSEFYTIDDAFHHTYNNQKGIWRRSYGAASLETLAKSYLTTPDEILFANGKKPGDYLGSGYIFVPFGEDYDKPSKKRFRGDRKNFIWPVQAGERYLTSRHGKRWGGYHTGLDIACPTGTVIIAARSGRITYSGNRGPLGLMVEIEHEPKLVSVYAHNSQLFVKEGDYVKKGQIIAFSGTTGRTTGPHLHFEVKYRDVFLNPEDFLPPFVAADTGHTAVKKSKLYWH